MSATVTLRLMPRRTLVQIAAVVPFEEFRSRLEAVWRKPGEKRKSAAGRKPWDAVVMLKAIILCELYNLSDEQVEYQSLLQNDLMFFKPLRDSVSCA